MTLEICGTIPLGYLLELWRAGFQIVPLMEDGVTQYKKDEEQGIAEDLTSSAIYNNPDFWTEQKIRKYAHLFEKVGTTFGLTYKRDVNGNKVGGPYYLNSLDTDSYEAYRRVEVIVQKSKPETYVSKTQKTHGYHVFWFSTVQNEQIVESQCKDDHRFAIFTENHVCTLPPSVHRDPPHTPYRRIGQISIAVNDEAHGKLMERLKDCLNTDNDNGPSISKELDNDSIKWHEGERNDKLHRAACHIIAASHGFMDKELLKNQLHRINERKCIPPLGKREVNTIFSSAWKFMQSDKAKKGNGNSKAGKTDNDHKTKAQKALEIVHDNSEKLFVDQHGTPYAAVKVCGHIETMNMKGKRFRKWICGRFYESTGDTLGEQDRLSVLNILEADAEFHGEIKNLCVRVAGDGKDVIWYDLTNPDWQAVKITPDGWTVEEAPILFRRYKSHEQQELPSKTYDADIFDQFIGLTNVKKEDDKLLLKCYIIACLIPDIPKCVLMPYGEQGSAKSTLQELIKMIIDPYSVKLLSFPRDIKELIQVLSHNYVAYFDNVSYLNPWVSDELCRAATGSGFQKRELYTDDDDITYNFMHCIGFNGINLAATKPDLLDRGLLIQLENIPRQKKRKIREIMIEFESIKPQLMGYIFDILSKAMKLQKEGKIDIKEYPRMADFAEWGEIISRAMGNPADLFLDAYYRNIKMKTQESIEANPIAACISRFMAERQEWEGSATDLLKELECTAEEMKINIHYVESWPKGPNVLSRRINEVVTNLRDVGIIVEHPVDTQTNTHLIRLRKNIPQKRL